MCASISMFETLEKYMWMTFSVVTRFKPEALLKNSDKSVKDFDHKFT